MPNETKLDAMKRELQELTSHYWELRSKVTELEARLMAISEMIEDGKHH
jgi:prefoldin subunit 5